MSTITTKDGTEPHGITATHQDQINAELLQFLRGSSAPRLRDREAATSVAG